MEVILIENILMEVRYTPDFAFKRAYTNDNGWFEMIEFKSPHKAIRKLFNLIKGKDEIMFYVKDDREVIYEKLMKRMGFETVKKESVSPTTLQYYFKKTTY